MLLRSGCKTANSWPPCGCRADTGACCNERQQISPCCTSSDLFHFLYMLPSFPHSSDLESDFNGDSNSEMSEGWTSLPEPSASLSPYQRWATLTRSPAVPEESPKTSKVADGKQHPTLGIL